MSGERILVVDDSKENREFIIDYILKPNGFDVLQARDGLEGMEQARQGAPDLILLDLQMPRLDGTGVLQALRRENMNIPVILMTFHGSEEIAIEVFRLGVRDYVKKPYTPEEMLGAIESNLTETRLRKEKDRHQEIHGPEPGPGSCQKAEIDFCRAGLQRPRAICPGSIH